MFPAVILIYLAISMYTVSAQHFLPVNNEAEFVLNFTNSASDICKNNTSLLKTSLNNHTLWAYRLWDASAKSTTGLTEGSTYQLGYYDECLSIAEPFTAQYCLTTVNYKIILNDTIQDPYSLEYKPYESVYKKLYYTNDLNRVRRDKVFWGLCVPAACSPNDIQNALQEYLNEQQNTFIRNYEVQLEYNDCQMKEHDLGFTIADYSFGMLVFILITIVTICTTFDLKYYSSNKNEEIKNKKSTKFLLCFSAKSNFNDLSKVDSPNKALNILYGTRCVMTYGIVMGHSILHIMTGPVFNFEFIEQLNRSLAAMSVCRGEVVVDFFFTISGLLGTYSYLVQSEKRPVNPIRQVILRYSRIAPIFLITTYFYATVLDKIGSGPMWNKIIGKEKSYCQHNWWVNLLFVSNYVDISNLCVVQGWYVSADFHMFLLSIPLNMLIKRNTKLSWIVFSTVLSIFVLVPVFVQYLGEYDPVLFIFNNFFYTIRDIEYFRSMYLPTHNRVASYLIGMLFGFMYYKLRDSKFKLSASWCVIITITAAIVQSASVLGGVIFFNPYLTVSPVVTSLYVGLHKPAFVTASGLLLFTLSYGTVPYFPQFLSWFPFIPLAKLTFGTYIVSMAFQLAKVGSTKTVQTFSIYSWFTSTVVEIVLAQFAAFILYILVENPFNKLMKELIPPDWCNNRVSRNKSESTEDVIAKL